MTFWQYASVVAASVIGGGLAYALQKRCKVSTSPSTSATPGPHGAPVAKVTPEMTAWAKDLLNDPGFPLGSETSRDFNGVEVTARAETHTWYGADLTKASAPHKGISLYYA